MRVNPVFVEQLPGAGAPVSASAGIEPLPRTPPKSKPARVTRPGNINRQSGSPTSAARGGYHSRAFKHQSDVTRHDSSFPKILMPGAVGTSPQTNQIESRYHRVREAKPLVVRL